MTRFQAPPPARHFRRCRRDVFDAADTAFWRPPVCVLRSAFGWGRGDGDLSGFRLVAQAGRTLVVPLIAVVLVALAIFVALVTIALLVVPALIGLRMLLLLRRLTIRLALLLGLVHRVKNAEVMFRVLEEGFCRHPVSTAGRVAAELEIFFEQLLGGAADADFRPVTVENMVAIERNASARMMADSPARSATTTVTAA